VRIEAADHREVPARRALLDLRTRARPPLARALSARVAGKSVSYSRQPITLARSSAALAFWLAALSPAAAHAQSASNSAQNDANALLRQADAAFEVRDFARALQLFRRAYERQQDPTILYNVATMYAALEQWSDAIATWRLYLERVPDAPNRATTLASIRDAEARLRAAPTTAVPTPPVVSPPLVTPRAETFATRTRWPVGAWVTTAVGGASAITGAVLLGLYASAVAELESPANCSRRTGGGFDCEPDALAIRNRAQSLGTAGAITMSVGGAALVGGLVWALAGRSSERVPIVTMSSAGITVVGSF
jgi:tetratricopeptide (TPR) repeat protein